ncbi:MAG: hypothetical protein A2033_19550 [Bacteroidetes bacterium GWA2_31_9]|nr:MAG: hypothetical protein A2033_19550 [Bacteroidetes bacterium GWA2_31_9]
MFTLLCWSYNSNAQTVTDIDGNVYNTVTIGTQVWMKENLKVTKYNDGSDIGTTSSPNLNISSESNPKYLWAYNGLESNVADYGRLYTWYAVTDNRKVCPVGWHVPGTDEWTTLTDYLGGTSTSGLKLREAGTSHWTSPNTGADNSSGFTALPGGYRHPNGTFYYMGGTGFWWSTTDAGGGYAYYRSLSSSYAGTISMSNPKNVALSVRCLSDSQATGFNENIKKSYFKLYPNPNDGKFKIMIANFETDKITIEIYNLMGEKVLQQKNSNEVDLSNSPKGVYFVKVSDGTKVYNQRIVVQ